MIKIKPIFLFFSFNHITEVNFKLFQNYYNSIKDIKSNMNKIQTKLPYDISNEGKKLINNIKIHLSHAVYCTDFQEILYWSKMLIRY